MKTKIRTWLYALAWLALLAFSVNEIVYIFRWGFVGVERGDKLVTHINLVFLLLPAYLAIVVATLFRFFDIYRNRTVPPMERSTKIAYFASGVALLLGVVSWAFQIPVFVYVYLPVCYLAVYAFAVAFSMRSHASVYTVRPTARYRFLGVGVVGLVGACVMGYQVWATTEQVRASMPYYFQTSPQYFAGYAIACVLLVAAGTALQLCDSEKSASE